MVSGAAGGTTGGVLPGRAPATAGTVSPGTGAPEVVL